MPDMVKINRAWITTNISCNLRCRWCYALHSLQNGRELPIDKARQIADTVIGLGAESITLIGGEPTLYSGLLPVIRYIKEKSPSARVGMTTNGLRMADSSFAKELMDAGIDGCNVSIKGLSEEDYAENTGDGSGFKKMLEGYRNMESLGLNVTASYVIASEGTEQIDRLQALCRQQGIKKMVIQFVKPEVRMESEKILPMKEMAAITEYICRTWSDDIDYMVEISFPICLIDSEIYEELVRKGRVTGGCHVRTGTGINYDIDGRLIPCNHFINMPYADEPSMTEESVMKIRDGDMYREVKERAVSYPSVKCKSCIHWQRCGGGCFTRWFYENPTEIIG